MGRFSYLYFFLRQRKEREREEPWAEEIIGGVKIRTEDLRESV